MTELKQVTIYDIEGGNDVEAAKKFLHHLIAKVNNDAGDGFDITIDIGDAKLIAYDLAAFVSSLESAVEYLISELD